MSAVSGSGECLSVVNGAIKSAHLLSAVGAIPGGVVGEGDVLSRVGPAKLAVVLWVGAGRRYAS